MNEKTESKQEWCVTTAKRAFVNARAGQLDAEIVSESKPTSEGAREWLLDRSVNHDPDYLRRTAELLEAYAAPFRSQLAAAEKERDTAIAEVGKANRALGYAEYEAQRLRERITELELAMTKIIGVCESTWPAKEFTQIQDIARLIMQVRGCSSETESL